MVMYTFEQDLRVGQHIVNGRIANLDREWDTLTFIIKREATKDDYLDYLKSIDYDLNKLNWNDLSMPDVRFYEILTD